MGRMRYWLSLAIVLCVATTYFFANDIFLTSGRLSLLDTRFHKTRSTDKSVFCESGIESLPLVYDGHYGLCTTPEGKPIIWVYWDKSPARMPAFIKLAVQALKCHNEHFAHVEVVDDEKFAKMLAHRNMTPHPAYLHLTVNHKSDYFRGIILYVFGGFYTDADALPWASLKEWFDTLKDNVDVFGYSWPGEVIGPTWLGPMRANNSFIRLWTHDVHLMLDEKMPQIIKENRDPIGYATIARDTLNPAMRRLLNSTNRGGIRYKSLDGYFTFGLMERTSLTEELWRPFNLTKENQARGIDALHYSTFPLFVYFDDHSSSIFNVTSVDEFFRANITLGHLLQVSLARGGCKVRPVL